MHMLSMTKKMYQFLQYFIIGEWIFHWFNIGPSFLLNMNCSWRRADRFYSLWFCFWLWSACKILCIQKKRKFFELFFWNFCVIDVQIHHELIWSMWNSDPRVSVVSVQRHNSDLISIFTVHIPGTGRILVFPWIQPFGCDASSLGRVYSRQATAWNCERSAVSFVLKYCPISTTFRNPVSIQILLNLSCCDSFSIRSPHCCNRKFWCAGSSQSKGASVLITLSTSAELDCPITTGRPDLSWWNSYSSHISANAP